jgi:hypothetical protein
MRKKAKVRAWEQRAYRTTPRGAKHLYTYWRNVRSPTDVSFEEWFVLRNSAFPEVRGERITICRYDNTKPWFLENLYVARTRGSKELEMLFDAQTLIGTRKAVCVYAAPAGKMDARRN